MSQREKRFTPSIEAAKETHMVDVGPYYVDLITGNFRSDFELDNKELTPSEKAVLFYLLSHQGLPLDKSAINEKTGITTKSLKTVMSGLRRKMPELVIDYKERNGVFWKGKQVGYGFEPDDFMFYRGRFTMDPVNNLAVSSGGEKIPMTAKELVFLYFLSQDFIKSQTLLDRINVRLNGHKRGTYNEAYIKMGINTLRKKMGFDFIESSRNFGYRIG